MLEGVFANKIGRGYTPVDGYGFVNAEAAIHAVQKPLIQNAMMRCCTWVNPVFVCQLKFAEWTRDGKPRQPVFLGMREDKNRADVTREMPR